MTVELFFVSNFLYIMHIVPMKQKSTLVIQILNVNFYFNDKSDHYLIIRVSDAFTRCSLEYRTIEIEINDISGNVNQNVELQLYVMRREHPLKARRTSGFDRKRIIVDHRRVMLCQSNITDHTAEFLQWNNIVTEFSLLCFTLHSNVRLYHNKLDYIPNPGNINNGTLHITPTGLRNETAEDFVISPVNDHNVAANLSSNTTPQRQKNQFSKMHSIIKSAFHASKKSSLIDDGDNASILTLNTTECIPVCIPPRHSNTFYYSDGRSESSTSDIFSLTSTFSGKESAITPRSSTNTKYYTEKVHPSHMESNYRHENNPQADVIATRTVSHLDVASNPVPPALHLHSDNIKVTGYIGNGRWTETTLNRSLRLWYLQSHIPSLQGPTLPPKGCPPDILMEEYYLIKQLSGSLGSSGPF